MNPNLSPPRRVGDESRTGPSSKGYPESDNVALISFLCIGLVFIAVLCTVLGVHT